jgi:hypothetical protein
MTDESRPSRRPISLYCKPSARRRRVPPDRQTSTSRARRHPVPPNAKIKCYDRLSPRSCRSSKVGSGPQGQRSVLPSRSEARPRRRTSSSDRFCRHGLQHPPTRLRALEPPPRLRQASRSGVRAGRRAQTGYSSARLVHPAVEPDASDCAVAVAARIVTDLRRPGHLRSTS